MSVTVILELNVPIIEHLLLTIHHNTMVAYDCHHIT